MTGQVMLYAIVVGLLLVPAAWLADRAASLGRVPRRWGWAAALAMALALPMFAPLRNPAGSDGMVIGSSPAPADQQGRPTTVWTVVVFGVRDGFVDFGSVIASWEAWAATAWLASSAGAAVWFGAGVTTLRRRRRGWRRGSVLDADVLLAGNTGPAVVGVVRPVIVLPEWAMHLDRPALALIVRHEREHIAARDPWLVHVAALAVVVMPWNPAVWWLASRLRLAVEVDCDARVLARAVDRPAAIATYGDALLQVATRHERRAPVAVPAMFESASSLSRRITAMCVSNVRGRGRKIVVAGVGAACLFASAFAAPIPAVHGSGPLDTVQHGEPEAEASRSQTAPPVVPVASRPSRLDLPGVRRPGDGVTAPVPVRQRRPNYTPDAMRRKAQGRVTLEVLVDEFGRVSEARVVESLDLDLDAEAVAAAHEWLFEPGVVNGRPVETAVMLEMEFTLH